MLKIYKDAEKNEDKQTKRGTSLVVEIFKNG